MDIVVYRISDFRGEFREVVVSKNCHTVSFSGLRDKYGGWKNFHDAASKIWTWAAQFGFYVESHEICLDLQRMRAVEWSYAGNHYSSSMMDGTVNVAAADENVNGMTADQFKESLVLTQIVSQGGEFNTK